MSDVVRTTLVKGDETMSVRYSERRQLLVCDISVDGRVEARDRCRGDLPKYRAKIQSSVKRGWAVTDTDQADLCAPKKRGDTAPVVAEDGKGGWAWVCPVKGCQTPYGTSYTRTNARLSAQVHQAKH